MKYSSLVSIIFSLLIISCSIPYSQWWNSMKNKTISKNKETLISISCSATNPKFTTEIHVLNGKVFRKIYGEEDTKGQDRQLKLKETHYLLMDGKREYTWIEQTINGEKQKTLAWSKAITEKEIQAYRNALKTNKSELLKKMNCTKFSAKNDQMFHVPDNIVFNDQDESYNKLTPSERDAEKIWLLSF